MGSPQWQPSASIASLKQRAEILANVRHFFISRNYLEVETPIMARHGVSDIHLSNIKSSFRGDTYYLQTSPEYHMKRLLACGSGPIFQIAKVFRDDEYGRWHNPEFSLLEWYQLGIDHHTLLEEVDTLLQGILQCDPLVKMTYKEVFQEICGINPLESSISLLQVIVKKYELDNVLPKEESDPDQYLFLLMSHVVEPALIRYNLPVAIVDFPPSQASLAQIKNGVAQRFEIYFRGVELANGFHELTDPKLQRERFAQDNLLRMKKGLAIMKPDEFLLQALEYGLPSCSGVAMGLDRLIALALDKPSLDEILSFDFNRA